MQRQGKLSQFLIPAPPPRIPRACKTASADAVVKPIQTKTAKKLKKSEHGSDCNHVCTDDHPTNATPDAESDDSSRGDTHHCGVCEGRGSMLLCDGPCGRGFHADCMKECPDTGEGNEWLCKECKNKVHECFICKQDGEDHKGQ
jgi:hypothetical protein